MSPLALVLLTLAALIVGFMLLRSKTRDNFRIKTVRMEKQQSRSKYHAVQIKSSLSACQAAQALQGKPFLCRQAPAIPLPECDHSSCKCHYSHHQDRRIDDRRGPYATALEGVVLASQSDRRHRIERRQATV